MHRENEEWVDACLVGLLLYWMKMREPISAGLIILYLWVCVMCVCHIIRITKKLTCDKVLSSVHCTQLLHSNSTNDKNSLSHRNRTNLIVSFIILIQWWWWLTASCCCYNYHYLQNNINRLETGWRIRVHRR